MKRDHPRPLAVVTGGSRGIGRAFVLEAARRGYDVVFSYRSREADASRTVELAAGLGGTAKSVRADLEDFNGVNALASAARARGRASLLVNNAGIGEEFTLEQLTPAAWERSVAINLRAPTFLAKELKADLVSQRGAILNVSSDGGVAGSLHGAPYGATKAGLIGLTKTLVRDRSRRAGTGDGARDAAETDRPTRRLRARATGHQLVARCVGKRRAPRG